MGGVKVAGDPYKTSVWGRLEARCVCVLKYRGGLAVTLRGLLSLPVEITFLSCRLSGSSCCLVLLSWTRRDASPMLLKLFVTLPL